MLVVIPFLYYITWTFAQNTILPPIKPGADDCMISTRYKSGDLKEPQPLLLKRNGEHATIWYPDNNRKLTISKGNSIYLTCPGKNNYVRNRKIKPKNKKKKNKNWGNEVKAVCVKNKIFDVNGVHQDFSSLVCDSNVWHDARRTNELPCLNKYTPIEIGFNVNDIFIRTIELCHDEKTLTTYYTKFKMTKRIENSQRNYPRPKTFIAGRFYSGIDIDYLYNFETQLDTFAKILKSPELAKKRLNDKSQFLSRGHLAAKSDFVYGAQQRSAFWYLNTAPQWKTVNEGNWNFLENSVRRFAAKHRLDIDVYTGVYGQMTMEDINGIQQPVYLHPYISAKDAVMPVPKFYWKVIYDPLSMRGTAFVSLNDPFIKSITDDVYLCTDISKKIKWVHWKPRDIISGISYACSVADLQKAVPVVPPLDVIDILI